MSFAGQIPAFILGPIAGVWVDRRSGTGNLRRTLVITQALAMLQSFALAALALSGTINLHEIVWLAVFQGVINAFDMPARQSYLVEMVANRDDLGNAIALNSSIVNGARLVGPAIAGLIIGPLGEGWCFFIDGVSYIAVIASLLSMTSVPQRARLRERRAWGELADGWNYVTGSVPIRSILLLLAFDEPVGNAVYGVDADLRLESSSRRGAHAGVPDVGRRRGRARGFAGGAESVIGLGKRIAITSALFGVSLIGFGLSRVLWLSLLILPITGFGMMQEMAASNTILQTIVEDDKRGRVMSFYSMAFQGMAPFGSLLAGGLAAGIGAPKTLVFSGALCIAGAIWFGRQLPGIRVLVRPIYTKLGILPELATGVQRAAELQTVV